MAKTSRIDMKDTYLYIFSAATVGVPARMAFKFSEGNFTFTVKKEKEFILNRGTVVSGSVREANETPMAIKFEGEFSTMYGEDGIPDSAYEFLMGEGDCAEWAGAGTNNCEPYATYLVLVDDPTVKRPTCGTGEILLFRDFFCDTADFDVNAGTLSFDGRCKRVSPEKIPWPSQDPWTSVYNYPAGTPTVPLTIDLAIPSSDDRRDMIDTALLA